MNPVSFVREAYQELRKSAWLPRKEAVQSTVAVIIICALLALFAGAIDMILSTVLGAFLGRS